MVTRCAGLSIPVFSLRSKKGLGVGEFYDLISLIDWSAEAGLSLIQILPVNDTALDEKAKNGYPYSILSVFALHPIYLHISSLASKPLQKEIETTRLELSLPALDYGAVYLRKKAFLQKLFAERGEKDLATSAFAVFFEKAKEHLKPYAAFCLLRDQQGTSAFGKWKRGGEYSEALVNELCLEKDARFYFFVQFHLHKQLSEVHAYAKKKKILLKGDLSVGVHPHSVEAWQYKRYFVWNRTMGAPPDFYNALGQNWGFPPYDWDAIKKENYFWLTARIKWMENYFDAVRLDHVLGYFRFWEIPKKETLGLMGIFHPALAYTKEEVGEFAGTPLFLKDDRGYHPRIAIQEMEEYQALPEDQQEEVLDLFRRYYLERQEGIWEESGREKLRVMQKRSKLTLFAEDIGVIPACVGRVLKELGIPNLHVQRMPKSFSIEYEDPKDFPDTCVCIPSNHDTATLREWWEEDEEKTQRYYEGILGYQGKAPKELTEELAKEIIQAHLDSPAQVALFLMQDLFALSDFLKVPHPKKERINDPACPRYKWNWRMHLYLEELLLAKSFTKTIQTMVEKANR